MFERDGQAVYFGVTAVENIFLTELMPAAKGDFVKVYLCALFHSGQKEEGLSPAEIAQELGQSTAQQRIWDGMRAIDYLYSRGDVSKDGVGCMGNSGGGTMTSLLESIDPRIVSACPSCYISSLREV